jgi:hypothetical protein
MKNSELFNDLLRKQLKNISADKKLKFNDLKRLCKYISVSIFDENICSIWNGYITNINNIEKGIYINFYFKGKKVALHRLLYCNFIGDLGEDEYLKFTCQNKGKCCNVHHLRKFKYLEKKNSKDKKSDLNEIDKKETVNSEQNVDNPNLFILSFD